MDHDCEARRGSTASVTDTPGCLAAVLHVVHEVSYTVMVFAFEFLTKVFPAM